MKILKFFRMNEEYSYAIWLAALQKTFPYKAKLQYR